MIDEKLYRETFSRLRASDEAKKEVLVKMSEMNEKKTVRRPWKALRAVAMAAMLTLALAVTANAASNGALFENLRIIWQDDSHIVMEDDGGNRVEVVGAFADAELRDGRLVLTVNDAEYDITEDIVENGAYSATVEYDDGSEVEVNVTGTLEDWNIQTSIEGGDMIYSLNSDHEIMSAVTYPACTTTVVTDGD